MPGSNERALEKAKTLPADGVIFDLEDSVAPDRKADARAAVAHAEPPEDVKPAPERAATEVQPSEGEAAPEPAPVGNEGARVIALNMALSGSTRDETAAYLAENFELDDPEALLDEVYARAGG